MTNSRKERFADIAFPFSSERIGWSMATEPGRLTSYSQLNPDGTIVAQLHTGKISGMWVDDLVALTRFWLSSLPPDEHRMDAKTAITAALLILDARATARHNWSESPEEKATPPPADAVPSRKEWIALYDRSFGKQSNSVERA